MFTTYIGWAFAAEEFQKHDEQWFTSRSISQMVLVRAGLGCNACHGFDLMDF